MTEEKFPLALESVIEGLLVGDFLPAFEEIDGLGNVWIPSRSGRCAVMLHPAIAQAGYGGAFTAVYLQSEQIVAANADTPG